MSLLRFNFPRNMCPPDEYVYHHQDGYVSQAKDQDSWFADIRKHFHDNAYPMPENIEELAVDQLCRVLPPGFCQYDDGSVPEVYVSKRYTAGDFIRGMAVLAEVATANDPLVSPQQAEERARLCAACPANVFIPGCTACNGTAAIVANIRGKSTTTADPYLKNCAICACSCAAQVWVKAEHLAKGVTPEMLRQFDAIGHCWKGREIQALQAA